MDLSHVKVRQVIELRYGDDTYIDDAVDHALAHSAYNHGAIVRWDHHGILMECKQGDNRKERQSYWHQKRCERDAREK